MCDEVTELRTGGALGRLREHLRQQLHRQVWPSWFREWPSIEREALTLRSWEWAVIPGLLETADYARTLLRGVLPDASDEEVEEQATARLLPGIVAVRDSKNPDGPALTFGPADWHAVTAGIKTGDFNLA